VNELGEPRRRQRRPAAGEITPDTPIWCQACQRERPARAVNKETRRFSGLSGVCREAQRAKRLTPEGKFATKKQNTARWSKPTYRARSLEWQRHVASAGVPRGTCAEHRRSVAGGDVLCASAARIRAELEKCVPRCARCHRRVTQMQRPSQWRTAERLPPSRRHRLDRQDANDLTKVLHGCADCGWNQWARGLDWDHIVGSKVAGIAGLIANGRPWPEAVAEMAKCEVVCANCLQSGQQSAEDPQPGAEQRTPGECLARLIRRDLSGGDCRGREEVDRHCL
jgi:hypothetical protein